MNNNIKNRRFAIVGAKRPPAPICRRAAPARRPVQSAMPLALSWSLDTATGRPVASWSLATGDAADVARSRGARGSVPRLPLRLRLAA